MNINYSYMILLCRNQNIEERKQYRTAQDYECCIGGTNKTLYSYIHIYIYVYIYLQKNIGVHDCVPSYRGAGQPVGIYYTQKPRCSF